jgi:multidrug efflux pump subunit AcrB
VEVVRGYSKINRLDQQRAVTISANIDEAVGNARNVVQSLRQTFMPELLERHPDVRVLWEGQQEQTQESVQSLFAGFGVALLAMFVLLSFQFKSYFQPFLILLIIPFGVIGAIAGHTIIGLPLTLFSLFGMVALTGVVVNDSIVLVDCINARVHDGMPVRDALAEAGSRRFRPVLLTTVTTVVGLTPILLETSAQAQLLIPMATSIAFGEILGTLLVLYLVPVFYSLHADVSDCFSRWSQADSEPYHKTDVISVATAVSHESLAEV